MRKSGILMHVTSLPNAYGIGSMGQCAYDFVDFLVKASQKYLQILPLGATCHGESSDSPYQAYSAFAGNPYFINLETLVGEGVLTTEECEKMNFGKNPAKVDYDALYEKLKNGEKLVWKTDYGIAHFSTGITDHLENCIYQPSTRLSVPNFAEPCPFIDTFCFLPWKDQLSTSFSVTQYPENVCGLCLTFPAKIEYENDTEKHSACIIECACLDDFATYETLVERIKSITNPLKLDFNGKVRRTSVRISDEAKKDFCNFYFATSNDVTIL